MNIYLSHWLRHAHDFVTKYAQEDETKSKANENVSFQLNNTGVLQRCEADIAMPEHLTISDKRSDEGNSLKCRC